MKPIEVFMRCVENRVEDDYDGGMVRLQAIRGQSSEIASELADGVLALSCTHDGFMRQFPVTRDDKQRRFYKITVLEVAESDLPPDPTAQPELFNASGQRVDRDGKVLGFDRKTGDPR